MKNFMHPNRVSDKYYLFKRLLIMKLTLFLILIFNIGAFADVYSQTKISLSFKDADLKQVLRTIERKSNYRFVYSERNTPTNKKITISATNESVTDVLDKILGDVNLVYKDQGNNLLAIATPDKMAEYLAEQQAAIKVSGIVTDLSTGETLIGATVRVKGVDIVTSVDVAGKFSIDVPNANSVLVVNYIGYTELEVPVEGKTVLDIKLSKVTTNLEEVVVTGFGLTTKKATLAGAISTVTADELSHSRSATAAGALVGRVPGINFRQTTGRPGVAPDIQIRNFGTPLIVIDGVTRDMTNFSNLDFNDIESISVLKDGSAAIYGMQAANGAIVVTTKKGKRNQKPTIGYQGYYAIQAIANSYNKPADIKTYIKAIVQDETYNNRSRTIDRAEYDKWMNESDDAHKGFDWFDFIWGKPAPQIYNSFNLSGGSENTDYYVSAGNLQQKPIMRNFGDGFSRTNFQTNINSTVSKRIKVGFGVNAREEKNSNAGLPGDDYGVAESAAFKNLPIYRPYANDNPDYPAVSTIDKQSSYGWVGYKTSGTWEQIRRAVTLNGNVEISILPGLKARALGSYSFTNQQLSIHEKAPTLYSYDKTTNTYNVAYSNELRYVERNFSNSIQTTTNFQLEYKKSFGLHNIQANAGMETRSSISPSLGVVGAPAANGISFIPNLAAASNVADNVSYKEVMHGYITRLNYDYAGKYIAEFSGSYNGSFFYESGRRYGFFPSGALAYRISEEDFWKKSPILSKVNDLKLKASYGILGQNLGGALAYIDGYNYGNQGVAILNGQDVISARIGDLATHTTWGRVKTLNIGVDITLLKNKLSGGFEYFDRHSTGQLASRNDVLLPDLVGFARPNENLNSDHTRGIEASVNWRDAIGKVNYFFGGSMTFSRWITGFRYNPRFSSEWDKFRYQGGNDEGRFRDGTMQLVGIGQFKSWEEIANYPIDQDHEGNRTIRPGDFILKDSNGDGFINDLDYNLVTYRVNNGTPWINFNFNLGASYKGIEVRADFVGGTGMTYEQQGYMKYFDPNQNVSQYLADNSTWYKDIFDKNSGFNIGKYPLLTRSGSNTLNAYWPSNFWQTNVTYVKLRNLEIAYTIPYTLLKPIGISNLRFYVSGQNVLAISNMPGGLDPEITSNGGNSYPNPRVYTMGVQVKF